VMKSAFSENRNAIAATIIANSAVIPTGYESYEVAAFYAVPVTLSSPHARPPVQGTNQKGPIMGTFTTEDGTQIH
jgi:hypothetical protein